MALFGLIRRRTHERAGFALYTAAVTAARDPALFGDEAVPDTLEGRFDLVALHAALLVRRLRRDPDPRGAALAQAVFDAMFADMDLNLREMGVGDMSIGKRVRSMWEAFHGRALAYEAALEAGDVAALEQALARNVWGGDAPEGAAAGLAAHAVALDARLAAQPFAGFVAGRVDFGGVAA
ncbi:ubiquinol-cytochrome C chaperone family protein [Pararoseomonas indoligenes]|uniref:Ubiquinol-cytochrome C chaperone n=1 Tax=Roseomonas indoligenes TaxID=2820811 RepID=A0A940MRS1_9PROT|nr:ubiquinol-cytochrome C chaperone family protein [Pararoseomonas indoligenes]MBP0492274.1 ubiquinol-cytochrome C chaperone [Pararoseomonas indoligenes]